MNNEFNLRASKSKVKEMEQLQDLTLLIEKWAIDRNIHTQDPRKQVLKLGEEIGELCAGMAKSKRELIVDSIGDAYVVLTIMAMQININMNHVNDRMYIDSKDAGEPIDYMLGLKSAEGSLASGMRSLTTDNIHRTHMRWVLEYLMFLAVSLDIDFVEAVQTAYEEIKDRKGKMIDGVFVKENDLQRQVNTNDY